MATLAIFLLFVWLAFAYPHTNSNASSPSSEESQQGRSQTRRPRGATTPAASSKINYTRFNHNTKAHQQECNSCHKFPSANWKDVRKGKDAFADITEYPEHPSCIKCHYDQFFARERPAPRICSVCHVAVTPRYTERKPFPNPPEIFNASKWALAFISDFRIQFSHDTHVELVGESRAPDQRTVGAQFERVSFSQQKQEEKKKAEDNDKSCAFCHQTYQPQGKDKEEFVTPRPKNLADDAFWLKKGTSKTTP
ncbi:MAG TPA: cytochrome c3 family protein, partial [Pyrinomonadaceae bacterium]|nr:cytochrome c3 family protein [Pyrinomonadaceae bacterium]